MSKRRKENLHEIVNHAQNETGMAISQALDAQGVPRAYRLREHDLRQFGVADPLPNRNVWGPNDARCREFAGVVGKSGSRAHHYGPCGIWTDESIET